MRRVYIHTYCSQEVVKMMGKRSKQGIGRWTYGERKTRMGENSHNEERIEFDRIITDFKLAQKNKLIGLFIF